MQGLLGQLPPWTPQGALTMAEMKVAGVGFALRRPLHRYLLVGGLDWWFGDLNPWFLFEGKLGNPSLTTKPPIRELNCLCVLFLWRKARIGVADIFVDLVLRQPCTLNVS